jgi:hypothetical protein
VQGLYGPFRSTDSLSDGLLPIPLQAGSNLVDGIPLAFWPGCCSGFTKPGGQELAQPTDHNTILATILALCDQYLG